MLAASVVVFSSPYSGIASLALAIAVILIARWRRIELPAISAWLLSVGTILLAIAATGPLWNHPKAGTIAVMVDLSPSTRGANFRDPKFVRERIVELIGNAPHQLIGFAAGNRPLDPAGPFNEIPADRTVFSPAGADAIILFSDARFDLPAKSAPIYPIVDSGLENVSDASVRKLESIGRTLTATITNTGITPASDIPRLAGVDRQRNIYHQPPDPARRPDRKSRIEFRRSLARKRFSLPANCAGVAERKMVDRRKSPHWLAIFFARSASRSS